MCWSVEGGKIRVEVGRLTSPMPTTPRAVWDDVTLQIAQAVARGEAVARMTLPAVFYVPPPPDVIELYPDDPQKYQEVRAEEAAPEHAVAWLRQLQADFIHVRLELVERALREGSKVWTKRLAARWELPARCWNLPASPSPVAKPCTRHSTPTLPGSRRTTSPPAVTAASASTA